MKEHNPELTRLLEKYRLGLCTEEEKARLMAWLDQLEETADPLPLPETAKRKELRGAFLSQVAAPQQQRARVIPFIRRYVAAAVVLVSVGIGAAFFLTRNNSNTHGAVAAMVWDTLASGTSEIRSIKLADNSVIALNANTRVRISKGYGKTDRKLELIDGEAWFDVQKNASLPFTVQCQQTETRVLGTRFVISAYKALPDISVQVTDGRVAVALPGRTFPLVSRGEAVHLSKENNTSTQDNFDQAAFDPLHQSCFIRNGSFNELALRIKNAFGYTLVAQNNAVSQRRFTGEFSYNEDITHILSKFSEIHSGTFRITGKQVIME